jgi:hypothetical protein
MPSQLPSNTLSSNERLIVIKLLGTIATLLELNGILCSKEITEIYSKLGSNRHDRRSNH